MSRHIRNHLGLLHGELRDAIDHLNAANAAFRMLRGSPVESIGNLAASCGILVGDAERQTREALEAVSDFLKEVNAHDRA